MFVELNIKKFTAIESEILHFVIISNYYQFKKI